MHKWIVGALVLIAAQAAVLYMMGQPLVCECGTVKLWEGVVLSEGNSQHISDWYTPSHVIHGVLFYLLLTLLLPRVPILARLFLAVGMEVAWELIENTPWVIDRYRQQALAQGYIGDSVLNSVTDTVAMTVGYLIARKAPVVASVILVVTLELWVGAMIRDNLTLNVVQLLFPLEAIAEWQMGN